MRAVASKTVAEFATIVDCIFCMVAELAALISFLDTFAVYCFDCFVYCPNAKVYIKLAFAVLDFVCTQATYTFFSRFSPIRNDHVLISL